MRRRDILAGLTGLALTLGFLWLAGLVWFAERVSHLAPQAGATDAIVVLTGGSERVAEGVALLAGGSARLLFVSGVPEGVTGEAILNGAGAGFEQVEHDMFKGPWVMGERYTICDPYLFTLAQWLEADGVDLARIPKVVDHRRRMSERPNVKKAIAQEFAP